MQCQNTKSGAKLVYQVQEKTNQRDYFHEDYNNDTIDDFIANLLALTIDKSRTIVTIKCAWTK